MKILVVDEFQPVAALLKRELEREQNTGDGVMPLQTATERPATLIDIESDYAEAMRTLANDHAYDVVIIDPRPQETPELGMRIVRLLHRTRVVTIAFATSERVQDCVECMRAGAWDYIRKGTNVGALAQSLSASIAHAFEERRPQEDPDAAFVAGNFDLLAEKYAGQWVAIGNGTFLDAAVTYAALQERIADIPVAAPKFWRMPAALREGSS